MKKKINTFGTSELGLLVKGPQAIVRSNSGYPLKGHNVLKRMVKKGG